MISELKIGNFKAFGPAQTIPLRPITLVFGPNSAGKSSIIQSLLLARHIQDTGKVDTHQTTLGGASVDLGGFARFVHRRDASRETTIQFSIPRSLLRGKFHDLDQFETLTLAYAIGSHGSSVAVVSVTLLLDGREVRRIVRTDEGAFKIEKAAIDEVNPLAPHDYATSMSKMVAEGLAGLAGTDAKALEAWNKMFGAPTRAELIEELSAARFKINGLALRITNPLPREAFYTTDDQGPEEHSAGSNPREFFAHVSEAGEDELHHAAAMYRWFDTDHLSREDRDAAFHPDESPESRAKAIRFAVEVLIEAANEAVTNGIAAIDYLGPLRWIPPRLIPEGEQFDASWVAGGGEAWQRLRREPKVLEQVNRFLRDTLHTRYRLECNRLAPALDAATIEQCIRQVREKVVNPVWETAPDDSASAKVAEDPPVVSRGMPPDADLAAALHAELDARASRSTLTELAIVHADSNLSLSHRDVGTGISQLLPVVVNAVAAQKSLIAIEQPELHLHPALQAELADVFIESALGENKNTFLIETHSEHLILRLLKRIRQTTGGMNTGLPPVRPEDVAILFVQPTETGSVVQHLRVDQHGRLLDDWPGGFFEESFNEMF